MKPQTQQEKQLKMISHMDKAQKHLFKAMKLELEISDSDVDLTEMHDWMGDILGNMKIKAGVPNE